MINPIKFKITLYDKNISTFLKSGTDHYKPVPNLTCLKSTVLL